jgi:uroporphyrinogen-III synthase
MTSSRIRSAAIKAPGSSHGALPRGNALLLCRAVTGPLKVVSLESRRSDDMARLLERYGFSPIAAPSMREVPLEDQVEALAFGDVLLAGQCDLLVLLTGVGLRALLDVLATRHPRERVIDALRTIPIACRGPKPVAVLKELGIKPTVVAPEPNTTRELNTALDAIELSGKRVYVQEYGRANEELRTYLSVRCATVQVVPVYAWKLPEDTAPLRNAIGLLSSGGADAVLFTSAQQIQHVLEVARQEQRESQLLSALARDVLVASIGPVTTEALHEHGIVVDVEPVHPKMGHLVKDLGEKAQEALRAKRRVASGSST